MARHAQETGFTSSGPINMGSQKITSLATGTSSGDAVNKAQMDAAMPIGAIIAFGGTSGFDTNVWALCDGTAHGSTALQAVIGSANTPDLRGIFVVGAGKNGNTSLAPTTRTHGTTGGAESVALATNQLPSHNHTGTTDSGGVAHTHGVTGDTASSGAHTHTGTTNDGGVAHTHGVSATTGGQSNNHVHWYDNNTDDGGYHNHSLDDGGGARTDGSGQRVTGAGALWNDGTAYGGTHAHRAKGYTGGCNDGAGNYADHTHSFSTTSGPASATNHQHGFTTASNGEHTHSISLTSGAASATSHTHTFTTGATGSGATHENMPPFYALTYLIKKA